MCRSPHDTTTCPCHCCKPQQRAAKRAATNASAAAAHAPELTPVPGTPASTHVPTPGHVNELAATIRRAYAPPPPPEPDDPDLDDADNIDALLDSEDARHDLNIQHGSPSRAICAVGAFVTKTAEEYAGITGEQVATADRERRATIPDRIEQLAAIAHHAGADVNARHRVIALETEWLNAKEAADTDPGNTAAAAHETSARNAYDNALRAASEELATIPDWVTATAEAEKLDDVLRGRAHHPDTLKDLRRLADAYTHALSTIRTITGTIPVRVTADTDDTDTANRVHAAAHEVGHHFPDDWATQWNTAGPVNVTINPASRGHYTPVPEPTIITRATPPGLTLGSDLLPVTLHEFTHRMCDTIPELSDMEEDYHRERTTNPDGTRTERVTLAHLGMPDEVVYAGGFIHAYMGKVYERRRLYEIMACGVEALFGGGYGGLIGVGTYRADEDMRDFVLGVLATGGQPSEHV